MANAVDKVRSVVTPFQHRRGGPVPLIRPPGGTTRCSCLSSGQDS
ncbi:hypothetical protein CSHISOI_04083 [Colletotrichum shisoi]|uniref:Uncharacterized protein n=1 Tax=Colletotrichum shisoi TaxID=2078593 RepID=A0A5Q4BWE9_9PEZI|nr:hypothetical protein CSHISOI_04083 [Colletotrichum shisoi]